jgi:hypothetical protein
MRDEQDDLDLGAVDRDRLLKLVERKLPHLLDEPARIDWYIAECRSYWLERGRRRVRDWPLTIINRMLKVEMARFHGQMPNPSDVRAEQAERRLAEAAVRAAECPLSRPIIGSGGRQIGTAIRRPREIE